MPKAVAILVVEVVEAVEGQTRQIRAAAELPGKRTGKIRGKADPVDRVILKVEMVEMGAKGVGLGPRKDWAGVVLQVRTVLGMR